MSGLAAKAPYLFGTSEKDAKELVVTVLSSEWPLSAKQVYHKIKREHGYDITYQGVYKVIKHLSARGVLESPAPKQYELKLDWLKEIERFSRITRNSYLETKSGIMPLVATKVHSARVRVYTNSDDMYVVMRQMLMKESEVRLSSKTPSLILKKEAELTAARKAYVNTLLERTRKNLVKVKYLFSSDLTKKKILADRDYGAPDRLRRLLEIGNPQLKHAPLHSVVAMAIGSKDCLIGFASPSHTDTVGVLHMSNFNTIDFVRVYDSMFANAGEPQEFLEDIEAELKKMR